VQNPAEHIQSPNGAEELVSASELTRKMTDLRSDSIQINAPEQCPKGEPKPRAPARLLSLQPRGDEQPLRRAAPNDARDPFVCLLPRTCISSLPAAAGCGETKRCKTKRLHL